jgi:SPASM domain peptide maturase of grasp-with-spasm system
MQKNILTKYFTLYSNCCMVKGYSRSIIYDIQRQTFEFIPNTLYTILKNFKNKKVSDVYEFFPEAEHTILDEYFELLLSKEFILLCDNRAELSLFPSIDKRWSSSSTITNAIIDIADSKIHKHHYADFVTELSDLGCTHLQLRFFCYSKAICEHTSLLELIEELSFLAVELIMECPSRPSDFLELKEIYGSYPKIEKIFLYSCSPHMESFIETNQMLSNIVTTSEVIKDSTHCGIVSPSYFCLHQDMFLEALQYNSCLNRKVGVDVNGNIKNCPSLSRSFGNICTHSLKNIICTKEFQELWHTNKDKIEHCKFCEFRYMCADCRAFATNKYGKPSTCKYNPSTCKWN